MQKTPLQSIAKIYNGNSINAKTKAEQYSKNIDGWAYVGTKDVNTDGSINYNTGVTIPFDDTKFKLAPENCVLVCSEGGSAGKKTAHNTKEICFGNKLYAIVNDKGLFNSKYVYYYTRYREFLEQFTSLMNGIIGGVSSKKFGTIEIPLPPLTEQEKIVLKIEELFSELDKGIEELEQAKARLKVYRQSVLKNAFEGEFTDVTLADCILEKPKNGYSPKAVDYETKYRNLTLTATTSGKFLHGYYKYIDIEIDDNSPLWVRNNDILIQRANTIDYVGAAALYVGEDNYYTYPDLMMKVRVRDSVLPKFVLYQLHTYKVKGYYKKHATGTAGNMPKINQKTVMETPLVFVGIEQQKQIVEQIESKLSVCDNIEQTISDSLKKAESLRQSILKKAFNGELV